ncbi:Hsp20/alpha crystallin family protein [Luteimicrobium sp. NPDC057192]|uniref:Hsp20/alpha crystallin family protein n=1 Tax=Luteimicrobium sp. NPDC057192 TaxID=3346042 RepID=UPI003629651E
MTATLTGYTDVDRLFRDLWAGRATRPAARREADAFSPAADVYRDGDDLVARFDLPGVDPKTDVSVEVQGRRLVVSGERKDARTTGPDAQRVRETRYGSFRRVVTLPRAASGEDVVARYHAGVLTVTVGGVLAGPTTHKVTVETDDEPAAAEPTATAADEAPEAPQA